ncbi:2-succinyl-5-enolpyruvyl-6-hydroxy-3-cyclohexene-1-carboxylic-acid synthase [Zhihengliuella flava]|uniref:2-succinyl-5-enolpyruvyl-6-hydroxy-3-cyclohexene-1-carboxylate synthase n=1 Tax=Zhihengliuella flava TaxID=1285193 RepID=A0A931DCZ2_9MICC|nr:2-succinyl-5-enolpyruvyl-6-hydroxy-3-cyclohexene-1-carboxylate synthase [Zhihengliuella flava]
MDSLAAARCALAELEAAGLRHLVISPGSRSAPLAYAAAEAEAARRLTVHVRIDERDAGFTALGLALSTGQPVAVAMTSGTAVGEVLPAVMEANHAGVPLVVLSADRPAELHGTGANQTTRQAGLFGEHVRRALTVAAGEDPAEQARAVIDAALGIAPSGAPEAARGPVQLNLEFRDPLTPPPGEPLPAWASRPRRDFPGRGDAEPTLTEPATQRARRTVVLAGHGAGAVAERFAAVHGLPLLAEPSSNARFGPQAIGPYRLLLTHFTGPHALAGGIERVVVFGRPTLSRPVARLLADESLPAALYVPAAQPWFEPGRRRETLVEGLDELSAFAGVAPAGWLRAWHQAAAAADRAVGAVLGEEATPEAVTGPALARAVWAAHGGPLVLGSSTPVRDADLAADPLAATSVRPVMANRGLAGIDGTVATALGVAAGRGEPTTLLLGDVTFLHDAGGLFVGAGEPEPDLDVVVLNDAGGSIFSTLEHGAVHTGGGYGGAVERLFSTPHTVQLASLAEAYGAAYVPVRTTAELAAALSSPPRKRRVIDVTVSRAQVGARGPALARAVGVALGRDAVG